MTQGFIDSPPAGTVVPRGMLRVSGWALGADGPLEDALLVLVDGRRAEGARTGMFRPDVAAMYPDVPRSAWSGWEATLDLRRAAGPPVRISLLARGAGADLVELDRTEVRIDQSRTLGGRRSRAVFTIVQNEADFLPLWLDYYGRHFDPADVYVLDHDSADGSTEAIGELCTVVPVHREQSFDHVWLKSTVEEFQSFLLGSYDAVLFAEADEFVVAEPLRHDGLAAYVDGLEGPAACCTGYNVVHYPEEEKAPLRFDQPLLRQRGYWHRSPKYSKRLIGRIPLAWTIGFHFESNAPEVLPDPSLYLIHLHRVDYDHCLARHRAAVERTWNQDDLEQGLGRESRVVDVDAFREWFFAGDDLEGSEREPIPERIRALL